MFWQKPNFFMQLAVHRLFGRLIGIDAALRELPGILPYPSPPEQTVLLVAENDPYIGPKTVGVYHGKNQCLSH